MTEIEVIEVWAKYDAEGNRAVAFDRAECAEKWTEDYSDEGQPARMIRVTLNAPSPRHVEVSATIPPEPTDATVNVN